MEIKLKHQAPSKKKQYRVCRFTAQNSPKIQLKNHYLIKTLHDSTKESLAKSYCSSVKTQPDYLLLSFFLQNKKEKIRKEEQKELREFSELEREDILTDCKISSQRRYENPQTTLHLPNLLEGSIFMVPSMQKSMFNISS